MRLELPFPILCAVMSSVLPAQTLQITNDRGIVLTGVQTVNVGEHVRLAMRASVAGTTVTNGVWSITGTQVRDWNTADAVPVLMTAGDFASSSIHFLWKDVTTAPNAVQATANVGGVPVSAQVSFQVVRGPKPEKYYSGDLLMERHNNWHAVYMFAYASTRRGDLFLSWHRSQLDLFNKWRTYFGYPPVPYWDPATPWVSDCTASQVVVARAHPASPKSAFSTRHDVVTLDLSALGLATATEGEYDLTTQSRGRGTNAQFVAAFFVLRTETVAQVLGLPVIAAFSRSGVATIPSWWKPNTGQTASDPWFASGCPANATPTVSTLSSTCSAAPKRSFDDYTLRELGESIESGLYASDFEINYHALGHVATSGDMFDPITSMRDPIFWAWHSSIDSILTRWQSTQGIEARPPLTTSGTPQFDPTWSTLRVAFSHRVVTDFVLPSQVTVNGSPATAVQDVSLTGTGYILEFSGFALPPSGPVEVVVRREVNTAVRSSFTQARPAPALIFSTFGNILIPAVNTFSYTKP